MSAISESLEAQVVVVTGGGSGIGLGIAQAFWQKGCEVVIVGRSLERLEVAKEKILADDADDGAAAKLHLFACDVSDRPAVSTMFGELRQKFGLINILVNCAGTNIANRSMAQMTPAQWDELLAINATGAYNCLFEVLPPMRERKSGIVFNVSSIAGKRALALGGIAYAASKFAMTALGTAVGNEVAEEGVRVTNVYPGEVNTPILDKRAQPVSEEAKSKMVQPEDIGKLVVTIAELPPRAHVPEIIIKPTVQEYV